MATLRDEVFEVAERLHRAGAKVTIREVRRGLRDGGSFSDIGPPLAEWKKVTNWRSRPPPEGVPVEIQKLVDALGSALWTAASEVASKKLAHRAAEIEVEHRAYLEVRADIGAAADALERQAAGWERRLRLERDQHAREIADLRRKLDEAIAQKEAVTVAAPVVGANRRKRGVAAARKARAFWDRVMVEVADELKRLGGGPTDAEELLRSLSEKTRAEAAARGAFTAGVLAKKMSVRAARGRYFEKTRPGEFALRTRAATGTRLKD